MPPDRPSSTALLIARCTLLADRDPHWRKLVPRDAIDPLARMLSAAGPSRSFSFLLGRVWGGALLRRLESMILPGIILHYLARKRWLEQVVVTALRDGCEQVVVLGAGFDTMAWRLHRRWPHVRFFELDHPGTQNGKIEALSSLAPGENLHFAPCDLVGELPAVAMCAMPKFDGGRRTCFVAEGLLMYFPVKRVAEILADLARLAPESILAFTFMECGPNGSAAFRGRQSWIDAWLRWRREPFAWAIAPEDVDAFLRPLGRWRVRSRAGAPELRREILAPADLAATPLAEGEWLCSAA
jgi:methyltransferase (TIGR00027 family)